MRIIKHILLLLFGALSGIIGFISIVVSISSMIISFSDIDHTFGRIFMTIWVFVVSEVLLAFGIAASLLGLRCAFGPKEWIMKIMKYAWSKAVKYALILPLIIFGFLAIVKLIAFVIP